MTKLFYGRGVLSSFFCFFFLFVYTMLLIFAVYLDINFLPRRAYAHRNYRRHARTKETTIVYFISIVKRCLHYRRIGTWKVERRLIAASIFDGFLFWMRFITTRRLLYAMYVSIQLIIFAIETRMNSFCASFAMSWKFYYILKGNGN